MRRLSGVPTWARLAAPIFLLVSAVILVRMVAGPEFLDSLRDRIAATGPVGPILFVVAFAVLTACVVSGTLLTLMAGALFGLWGYPLALAGAVGGAGIAFLASRYFVRERVHAMIERRPLLRAIDQAIGEDGWRICLLLRLSPPVPFSPLNWILGATSLRFVPYLGATALGIMPGSLLFVWVGSFGAAAASNPTVSEATVAAFIGLAVLCTGLAWFVTRRATRRLRELIAEEQEQGART